MVPETETEARILTKNISNGWEPIFSSELILVVSHAELHGYLASGILGPYCDESPPRMHDLFRPKKGSDRLAIGDFALAYG